MKKKNCLQNSQKKNGFIGIGVNAILVLLIVTVLHTNLCNDECNANAATVPKEEVDPVDYPDIRYQTIQEAIAGSNNILQGMDSQIYGSIDLLDTQNTKGELYLDYEMGGILYWELEDEETTIYLEAYNNEILKYNQNGWINGTKIQQEIETRANNIIQYFSGSIPTDSFGPDVYEETVIQSITVDVETEDETVTDENYWFVWYDRIKDENPNPDIITHDLIKIMINPNGDLAYYYKVWNMDLQPVDSSYPVSQTDAENTALAYTGSGSSVYGNTVKRIVRPCYFWPVAESPVDENDEPTMAYGLAPTAVWKVEVRDSDDNLCIYYVDGIENKIVGGDRVVDFFTE